MRYKRIGYNLNVRRQSACLVINPITVDGYAALFNCTPVDPSGKHLRTKVTPDFHLTYSKKWGKSGVGMKMIKMELSLAHECECQIRESPNTILTT